MLASKNVTLYLKEKSLTTVAKKLSERNKISKISDNEQNREKDGVAHYLKNKVFHTK